MLDAIQDVDADRARFYYDLVYNSLNQAARRTLEETMKGYQYQTEFAKKYVAEGVAKGRAEGIAKGVAKGRAEEAARNLLTVLRIRGIAVPDAIRERILAQKDPKQLESWLEKAVVATSISSIIDDPN